jgi:hypothetical protein
MSKTSPDQTHPCSPAAPSNAAQVSRRRFGKDLAIATAFSFSRAGLFSSPRSSSQIANAETQGRDADGGSVQNAEVEAKLANIVRKHGSRLSQEERLHLRKIVVYNEKMLASVRAFSLENGDSPATVFKVSVAPPGTAPRGSKSSVGPTSRSSGRRHS